MIFMGPLFNRCDEQVIKDKTKNTGIQNQANTFQWHCIDGLIENGETVHIMNTLPVGVFGEYYEDIILHSKKWKYRNFDCFEIGCINLPVLKQLSRTYIYKKRVKDFDDSVIIIYSTYLPILKAVSKLPKERKIVLIVTDLPEYYDYGNNVRPLRRILRKINNHALYKCMQRVDGFVLLTEAMHSFLKIENRPYTIIEGICSASHDKHVNKEPANTKNILYTGTLNIKFGIDKLMDAFMAIEEPSYRLQICGSGDYEETIKELSQIDNRIEFFGYVSREKALSLQHAATVLVNPRTNAGEYTKYSFPSKTMEYLQSGIPTIAYKLDGIPDDYDQYINYIEDEKKESLTKKIITICEDQSGIYNEKAFRAKVYVESEKNYIKQSSKIIELIKDIQIAN